MRFSTVVGHEALKLALLLAAVDPRIGGVLLRGEKGAGKTTIARALADLLPGAAPFVELPLGAGEDRVLGSIDLGAALADGTQRVRQGLLADADGGVLFVDEVNLLADHLVDTLLDVAVSGQHRLERDGISVVQPARFVLIGTMNPEEGELRPQLLDRFGLCVDVVAPSDPIVRAEVVRRRLAVDSGTEDAGVDDELSGRLAVASPAGLDDEVIAYASRLAVEVGAEGLRADLVLCRAAAALAGWDGRSAATVDDVDRVAPLALGHRRRRHPFDPPTLPPDELERAVDRARSEGPPPAAGADDRLSDFDSDSRPEPEDGAGPSPDSDSGSGSDKPSAERPVSVGAERSAPSARSARSATAAPSGRGRPTPAPRGRMVREHPHDPDSTHRVGIVATVRALATRRVDDPATTASAADLRDVEREDRRSSLVVICLDTSGSMGVTERIELATGTALGVLTDAYQRRDRVAVVAFGRDGAHTVLSPTSSVEVATARLAALTTGGPTPLAAGLVHAMQLGRSAARPGEQVSLVLITDGRATGWTDGEVGADGFGDALAACDEIRAAGIDSLVIDTETSRPRLGLAEVLAERLGTVAHRLDAQTFDPTTRSTT